MLFFEEGDGKEGRQQEEEQWITLQKTLCVQKQIKFLLPAVTQ